MRSHRCARSGVEEHRAPQSTISPPACARLGVVDNTFAHNRAEIFGLSGQFWPEVLAAGHEREMRGTLGIEAALGHHLSGLYSNQLQRDHSCSCRTVAKTSSTACSGRSTTHITT